MSDDIINRLKRVRGQIDGVISMYEDERACVDIVTQVAAARSALSSIGRELLSNEAVRCSRNKNHDSLDTTLKQLFKFT